MKVPVLHPDLHREAAVAAARAKAAEERAEEAHVKPQGEEVEPEVKAALDAARRKPLATLAEFLDVALNEKG